MAAHCCNVLARTRTGFEQMNEALGQRVGTWRATQYLQKVQLRTSSLGGDERGLRLRPHSGPRATNRR